MCARVLELSQVLIVSTGSTAVHGADQPWRPETTLQITRTHIHTHAFVHTHTHAQPHAHTHTHTHNSQIANLTGQ